MKIISHRGNVFGSNINTENTQSQIDYCILKGYDVEIDLWYIGRHFYLGHNNYDTLISYSFIEERSEYLWIHAKNLLVLKELQDTNLNYFWHQNDDYTITSKGFVWTYPGLDYCFGLNQILLDFNKIENNRLEYYKKLNIYGICLDYIEI